MNLKHQDAVMTFQEELKRLPSVEIASRLEDYDHEEILIVIKSLSKERLAEVFYELDSEDKEKFLSVLSNPEQINLIDALDSDRLVDAFQELPANIVSHLLFFIPRDRRSQINELLNYPEESVGSLMSVEFLKVRAHDTRSTLLERLKQENGDAIQYTQLFVVDDKRKLEGYINLADLIRHSSESIESLIHRDVIFTTTLEDQEVASKLFNTHHLVMLPVVDGEERIVGVITADDIYQVIEDELYEDMAGLHGVTIDEDRTYLETTPFQLFKDRVGWLLILMISAMFSGFIIKKFDAVLSTNVILAAYIPMLMDAGGNAGNQASTTIIRAIGQGEVVLKNVSEILFKELRVGLMVSLTLMIVNFSRILVMDGVDIVVAISVSLTLGLTLTISKMIGGLLPLLATWLKQDPAVMAGPLVTTIVDSLSLIIYFQIAKIFLPM